MTLVRFEDLSIDAMDAHALASFWATRLGWEVELRDGDDAVLRGSTPEHTLRITRVSEPKSVKHRVHLDISVASLDDLLDVPRLTEPGDFAWTVHTDPEGGEFCVFTTGTEPAERLRSIVVDAQDPVAIAAWWAEVWGGELVHEEGYSHVDGVAGCPFESVDFVAVPEPKTVQNRIRWDVVMLPGHTVDDLEAAGASVLRTATDGDRWTVMSDPEGNGFRVVGPR